MGGFQVKAMLCEVAKQCEQEKTMQDTMYLASSVSSETAV
jgi:hypothetical protein